MTSNDIITSLKNLINQFDAITEDAQNVIAGRDEDVDPLFLSDESCPTGFIPCDSSYEVCPDRDMRPPVYNSAGIRCYTQEGVTHKRRTTTNHARQVSIRDFVGEAAKLNAKIQELLKNVEDCSSLSTQEMCGMKSTCTWEDSSCKSARHVNRQVNKSKAYFMLPWKSLRK